MVLPNDLDVKCDIPDVNQDLIVQDIILSLQSCLAGFNVSLFSLDSKP